MSYTGSAHGLTRHAPHLPHEKDSAPSASIPTRSPRGATPTTRVLESGRIRVDLDSSIVTVEGRRVRLTRIEFQLLVLLIEARGSTLSHRDLLEAIRAEGGSAPLSRRLVHSHVRHLKEKLRAEGERILDVETADYVFGETSR